MAAQDILTDRTRLLQATEQFGFTLLQRLAASCPENIFISPLSISMALSMTANGAQGQTLDGLLKALNLSGAALKQINATFQALLAALNDTSRGVRLELANAIFLSFRLPVAKSFVQTLASYYQAETKQTKFGLPQAVDDINNWVSEKTSGKINQLVSSTSEDMLLAILNAVYFRGRWLQEFSSQSIEADFQSASGKPVPIAFMQLKATLSQIETSEYQAVALPYKNSSCRALIIMPNEPPDNLCRDLTIVKDARQRLQAPSAWQNGHLELPRFRLEFRTGLAGHLQEMGAQQAFSKDLADFSLMSSVRPIWIDEVIHKTYLLVNEKGTEAAAVTAFLLSGGMMKPEVLWHMRVDRPFLFAIEDSETGTLLFLGLIRDLSGCAAPPAPPDLLE